MRYRLRGQSVCLLLLTALLCAAATAVGQEMQFEADPAKSSVEFMLGDVLHTVHGTFRLKQGALQIDPATGKASGSIIVDAASGDSGNSTRDHKMNKEILESSKYPEISFTVQSMQGSLSPTGRSEVKLAGLMSIHGGEHPLTVTVPISINSGQATADVHFVVPYVQWGMKDPSTFVLRVSKEVDITAHMVGTLSPRAKP